MIKRLTKDDDESWALYPKFEKRVKDFAQKYDISCPMGPLLLEMQQRWISAPDLAGYFVSVQNNEIDAHAAFWITQNYGVNKLYVYQVESDENLGYFDVLMPLVHTWIADINSTVEPKLQVHKMEHCTIHPPAIWVKYFKARGYSTTTIRHVMELPIFPDLPPATKDDTI